MNEKIPSWLNEQFLLSVLQGGEDKTGQVSIVEFSATPAVATGDNYMSHLYRVQVTYKTENTEETLTSLIIKEPITEGVIKEAFGDIDLYAIEPKIYNELLPKLCRITNYEFGPKPHYCPLDKGLVLQDLKREGYIVCNKYEQLDYPHCEHALTVLAKFHAASVACFHDHPELIASVGKERVFVEGGPLTNVMTDWIRSGMETVAEIVGKKDECKPAANLVLSKIDGIIESLLQICKPKKLGLNVLNHGDLWINNIMFKHGSCGEVTNMKLIDFQITRYSSPALDLLYFIWTSANEDVRENKQQELYDVYLTTLNNTLEQLGCQERLSSEELQQDLKSAVDWAIVNICYDFPMLVCETEDSVDFGDVTTEEFISGENERLLKLYKGKRFNALIPTLMRQFCAWVSSS